MSEVFQLAGYLGVSRVVWSDEKLYFLRENNLEIFSINNKRYTIGNLVSNLIYGILSLFLTPTKKGPPRIHKVLVDLTENRGRLIFTWEKYINVTN